MINKLLRAFSRVFFHASRVFLRFFEAVVPRFYMGLYLKLLSMYGLKIKGQPRYISTRVKFDDFDKITLGERVVISENVTFLTHDYSLTTGLISIGQMPATDKAFLKPISIADNVFIGMGSVIMPGTVIESNVIIGAGSVVRGRVESNSIYLGNPAVSIGCLTDKASAWFEQLEKFELRID